MHALELTPGHRQLTRLFGAAGEHHRIVASDKLFCIDIDAHMGAVVERDALGFHLGDAAVDVVLLHLEVGNAVAHQAAGLGPLLVDMHVVTGARELLRTGEPRRSRADDGDALAGAHCRAFGFEALRDGAVGDRGFNRLDGDRAFFKIQRAGGFARRWADPAGDFGEIVGRVQVARGFFPIAVIDEVVPVRDLVVDRAAGCAGAQRARALAERNAAIHAARRLRTVIILWQRQHKFTPMPDTLLGRLVAAVGALIFEETRDLTHCAPIPLAVHRHPEAAAIASRRRAAWPTEIGLSDFGVIECPSRQQPTWMPSPFEARFARASG